ncbi:MULTISPECIES: hypothetical protein [unclassified Pseudomonas]|uniref:hypothetical protein n=1 Tax=unclassified Pseudomonas TaxID=196821 RepID=UPI002A36DA4B|nr:MULTISPECIES: hypothetical protein [unclassified Pseudomonas]MDX9669425.1 hypothetical protein [Pseudomonas sp. P8_250]WPN36536.1 hypothetical protein QMK53_02450 [Pseudomonas sp. P8_139]WPN41663.1 hypothetical protein QMK55_00420 [Pseudomonas sp. P8_229]
MKSLDKPLDDELSGALKRGGDLLSIREVLLKYRDKGFSAASVNELLGSMRGDADEELEDRILEVMDIVSGFCTPALEVW